MKKQIISLTLALTMVATGVNIGTAQPITIKAEETTTAADSPITDIPLFKSTYDFMSYVDNADTDYTCLVRETFPGKNNDNENGGVHEFTAPEDGTLIYYTFSTYGDASISGKVYSDYALTQTVDTTGSTTHHSTREEPASLKVIKGTTYYFRQERWNYYEKTDGITYMGLIPSSETSTCVTPTTNYNKEDNIEVEEFNTIDDFKNDLSSMNGITDYVEEEPVISETHSLTIEKSGWLLIYGYEEKYDDFDLEVFSDKELGSMIAKSGHTKMDEDPEAIWIEPGTYYFHAKRWNSWSHDFPLISYLGFIDASQYFSASEPKLSEDKTSSTITFTTKGTGSIRIMSGDPKPNIINSDDFWQVRDRANMISGNTYTATENGNYIARYQDNDTKMYFMVPFTVSGIVPKVEETPKQTDTTNNNTVNNNTNSTTNNTNSSTDQVAQTTDNTEDEVTVPGKPTIKSAKNVKGKKIKVVLKKKVSDATGYQISYSTNKKFKNATTKKFKSTSITLKKLKKKKTYYIRVRAYNTAGNGKWSATKKVKVKK